MASYIVILVCSLFIIYEFLGYTGIVDFFQYVCIIPNSALWTGISQIGMKWGIIVAAVGIPLSLVGIFVMKDSIDAVVDLRFRVMILYVLLSVMILL